MAVIIEKRNLCGLVIDAVVSESHSMSSSVTENPISTNSNIADHMFTNQPEIILQATFSDFAPKIYRQGNREPRRGFEDMPINNDESLLNQSDFINSVDPDFQSNVISENKKNAGITHFGSKASNFEAGQGEYSSRTGAAWCRLMELQESSEVCELVTGLKVYKDVVVVGASVEQNRDRLDKIDVRITLKRIKRVSAATTTISSVSTGKGNVPRGNKTPDCLKLNEVFLSSDASGSNITGGSGTTDISELTQIVNGNLRTARYSNDVWNRICSTPVQRYKNAQNAINQGIVQSESGLPFFQKLSFKTPLDFTSAVPSVITDEADRCREYLTDPKLSNLCFIPSLCGDERFVEDKKQEEEEKTKEPPIPKPTSVLTDEQYRGFLLKNVLENEITVVDPASQYYIKDSVTISDLEDEGSPATISDRNAQLARLRCYTREVLRVVEQTNGILSQSARETLESIED